MNIIIDPRNIDAILIVETDRAYLLNCEWDEVWFPKSEVNYDEGLQELEAPLWLLKEKFPGEY
jgi:hypothetical protein